MKKPLCEALRLALRRRDVHDVACRQGVIVNSAGQRRCAACCAEMGGERICRRCLAAAWDETDQEIGWPCERP